MKPINSSAEDIMILRSRPEVGDGGAAPTKTTNILLNAPIELKNIDLLENTYGDNYEKYPGETIRTNINPFSPENIEKDWEMKFKFNYEYSEQLAHDSLYKYLARPLIGFTYFNNASGSYVANNYYVSGSPRYILCFGIRAISNTDSTSVIGIKAYAQGPLSSTNSAYLLDTEIDEMITLKKEGKLLRLLNEKGENIFLSNGAHFTELDFNKPSYSQFLSVGESSPDGDRYKSDGILEYLSFKYL